MQFYAGSVLQIEWTNQHGCGRAQGNTRCMVVIQYACEDTMPNLRDGNTTTTIPNNNVTSQELRYGQQETYDYYQKCSQRLRNGGLFVADQSLGQFATSTRQSPGNTRHGFECNEERDYYPYWHPSPWRDIAILANDLSLCDYWLSNSQNVQNKGLCSLDRYNNPKTCANNGGVWTESGGFGISPPDCQFQDFTRDNHLGNTKAGVSPNYRWTVPGDVTGKCALRIRYNISSTDYDSWNTFSSSNAAESPIKNNPVKDFIGSGANVSGPLRLAVNTAQFGRVFQDRSHMFKILPKPDIDPSATIWNVNVRGRRGNIVQVYPSVEYDFVPTSLTLTAGDYVHFQWTGSDANSQNNDGNGRAMTDRSNIVQIVDAGKNYPMAVRSNGSDFIYSSNPLFHSTDNPFAAFLMAPRIDESKVIQFSYLNQTLCNDPATANTDQNAQTNCAVLNSSPAYFNGGLVQMTSPGSYQYMSTRNNQYTNRSQKALIVVQPSVGIIVAFAFILAISLGIVVYSSLAVYTLKRPKSSLARNARCAKCLLCCCPAKWKHKKKEKDGAEKNTAEADASVVKAVKTGRFVGFWTEGRIFMAVFILFDIFLYFYGFFSYLSGAEFWAFPSAKGAGAVLNFNCALVLVPVMRNLLSWLRTTPVAQYIPLDEPIEFHKIVGISISFFTLLHVVFHAINFDSYRRVYRATIGSQLNTLAGVTGIMLIIIMGVLMLTASERLRRRTFQCGKRKIGGYTIFYNMHQLYKPCIVILLLHGPRFWIWALWPLILFLMDRLMRAHRAKEEVELESVQKLAQDVMRLQLKKKRFLYKPGQFLYLNCPNISETEWHPFTITSAPEESFLSLHIRCRDDMDWTSKLRRLLNPEAHDEVEYMGVQTADGSIRSVPVPHQVHKDKASPAPMQRQGSGLVKRHVPSKATNAETPVSASAPPAATAGHSRGFSWFKKKIVSADTPTTVQTSTGGENVEASPEVHPPPPPVRAVSARQVTLDMADVLPIQLKIDGPYGAPAEGVEKYEIIVLVGAGIGVTPFASIMRSIQLQAKKALCRACGPNKGNRMDLESARLEVQKVYFYWICRDQQEFDWFKNLMTSAVTAEFKNMFELNTYMTGELNLKQVKLEEYNQFAGRPNWRRIFKNISQNHPSQDVGVFLCGPRPVALELASACKKFSAPKGTPGGVSFTFHKENF
eukprot:GILJ01005730.1.p1 GENE.GILJ01005730.1~~GILJ01005730.1.p1  ORF type:complete len:1207 (-),score=135.75 GILJ01005730.1:170-3724(-)